MRIALALVCAGLAFAANSPITHETLWLMKRLGAPVVSPDGKWVVVPATEPAYDDKDQSSDLWLIPSDSSAPPRRLTATRSPESAPAWSPDSRRIAFSARREGDDAPQIYLLEITAAGEAQRFTSLSTGATLPLWRPDGKAILFNSSVYPGAADDEANRRVAAERRSRKYNARVYQSFPIRYWDKWLDDRQTHLFVQALGDSKARDLLAGTKFVAGPGFAGTQTDSGEEIRAAWSPDGQSVVFAASTDRNAAAYAFTSSHLFLAPAAGGEPRQITTGEDSYSAPKFSPDGTSLVCAHSRRSANVYSLTRIARFAWPNPGERTLLTATLD
ncbi:MAG: S9 family peptidase, partial [Bryobacteraceae bacterium]